MPCTIVSHNPLCPIVPHNPLPKSAYILFAKSAYSHSLGNKFGATRYEVGKSTALLTKLEAHELAAKLGCESSLFIERLLWLFAAGDGSGNTGVWAREFAVALLLLSNGHHDDKRYGILTANGMAGTRHKWAAETRQWRQDELFRALRPILTIVTDVAVGHISTLIRVHSLSWERAHAVLATIKVRCGAHIAHSNRVFALANSEV